MSEREQEQKARAALYQEYGANARNWYNVLLAMAIVLFTAVEAKADLLDLGVWELSLNIILSQVLYAMIRAAVSKKLSESVVRVRLPAHFAYETYFEQLHSRVECEVSKNDLWKIGLWLGDSLLWWLLWTFVFGVAPWSILVWILKCVPVGLPRLGPWC